MQPCAVCGGVTISPDGYCGGCGTYRGVGAPLPGAGYPPQQPASGYPPAQGYPPAGPAYPPAQQQQPGYGYQQPASGPAYPTSGGPQGGYPTSGGPVYPTSGGAQYPPAYPPQQQPAPAPSGGRSKAFVIPLVALSVVLIVVVVAIVVVVLSKNGDDPDTPLANPTTRRPVATSSAPQVVSGVDPCVVGTWRVTSHTEDVTNAAFGGKVTFTGGEGAQFRLGPDGQGTTDYGSNTIFRATATDGRQIRLEINGTVSYRYTAQNRKFDPSGSDSDATARFYVNNEPLGNQVAFQGSDDAVDYTCSGSSMTQSSLIFKTEFTKIN